MLITEVDSYDTLCPMRMLNPDKPGRYYGCETSRCMAWRWYDNPDTDERRGYCGLAGRPHFDESGLDGSRF